MSLDFKRYVALALGLAVTASTAAQEKKPAIGEDEGRPRIDWKDAAKVIGKISMVYGKIVRVSHTNRVHFLNFDTNRDAPFTVVVFTDDLDNFPESLESMYENKLVEVRGMVTTYRGKPQIAAAHPGQIRVLEKLPDLPKASPEATPRDAKQVTVASYNIYNLFDAEDDPYHGDESTRVKGREELQRVADTIRKMNADVIALQEVESRGYLQRFVDVFLADMGYRVVHYEGNDLRGIDVCLLTRLPVGPVTSHRHVMFPGVGGTMRDMERDLLQVTLAPEGGPTFEVWVVHLKSSYDGAAYAEPIRLAEAKYLRRLLDERLAKDPDANILVCGDYNDVFESRSLRHIVGTGEAAMVALFGDVPEENWITYNREPYRSMIDFILASPAMGRRFVKDSYKIIDGSVETTGSDHNPILAKFRLTGH